MRSSSSDSSATNRSASSRKAIRLPDAEGRPGQGHLPGDLYDPRSTWLRQREIASGGAVLVRPDRFIAWRHPADAADPRAALAAALSQILARPVGAPVASAV